MKKIARVVSLLLAVITLVSVSSVSAQQSNGLGISPRKDYTVQPGKTVKDTLYIRNLSLTQDLQVDIRLIDFGAANETGTPALQLGENQPQTPWSLKPFATVQQNVKIAAGKSANVPIAITIPANQGAGSYYSAIEYTAKNPVTKEKMNVAASAVTLAFATVPGEAREKLDLKKFGMFVGDPKDIAKGEFKSFYLGSTPKEFAYRLTNSGNIAEQPTGSLLVKNMFGTTVKEVTDANPKKQLVLLGQTRRIQACLKSSVLESKDPNATVSQKEECDDPGLLPGRYTAQIALYYGLNGNNSQEILASTSFWYLPWWSVVAFVVVILLIVGLIWLIRRAFSGRRTRYRH
ncbi:MAG TPA: hypothetical protein VF733_04875 [Candidatus Saccharimonadales bacterium]